MPAVSKEQFRKIMMLCHEGKMSKEDCADYKKTNYDSLPERKGKSAVDLSGVPGRYQTVKYYRVNTGQNP